MKVDGSFVIAVESAIVQGINAVNESGRSLSVTDFYLLVDHENEEISVFDDNETLLSKERVEGVSHQSSLQSLLKTLREFCNCDSTVELIQTMDILRPFSIVLVDESFNPIEELLLIDDENLLLNNDLLGKIDVELEEFIRKLLSE